MNAVGAILTLVFVCAVLTGSRVRAALGIIGGVLYITQGQQVNVIMFHMTGIRFVLLAGFIRVLARGELKKIRLNGIDKALIGYTLIEAIIGSIRIGTTEEIVYQLGLCYDVFLAYFVFRSLITNLEDFEIFIEKTVVLIIPFTLIMLLEAKTGSNLFKYIGGLPPSEREGGYRCNGAFRSPMSSGISGATLLPLYVGYSLATKKRFLPLIGIVASFIIVFTSHSSGPLLSLVIGLASLFMWPMRKHMRRSRLALVIVLVVLEFVMKAHVWFLIAKVSDITGGDGWYRSQLINQFFVYFKRWWLMGTDNTGDWMPTSLHIGNTISADITDAYVNAGVNGGLLGLFFYLLIFVRCFQFLGKAMASIRGKNEAAEKILWGTGCALAAHAAALISVQYWDQFGVMWWGFVAIISSVTWRSATGEVDFEALETETTEHPDLESSADGLGASAH